MGVLIHSTDQVRDLVPRTDDVASRGGQSGIIAVTRAPAMMRTNVRGKDQSEPVMVLVASVAMAFRFVFLLVPQVGGSPSVRILADYINTDDALFLPKNYKPPGLKPKSCQTLRGAESAALPNIVSTTKVKSGSSRLDSSKRTEPQSQRRPCVIPRRLERGVHGS